MKCLKTIFLSLILVSVATVAASAARGPSTPEEREMVIRMVAQLEAEPLSDDAPKIRIVLLKWIMDVPDITVVVCGEFMEPIVDANHSYSAELTAQTWFGQAAYLVKQPSGTESQIAAQLAGVESALRTYERLLALGVEQRLVFFDQLLERRRAGTLQNWVVEQAARCLGKPM